MLESRLIARADPIVRVYHRGGPNGQRGYTGNVISLPKKLETLVDKIPRKASDCELFLIHQELNDKQNRDFVVRRWALEKWIIYLKKYNDAYKDVDIDTTVLDSYSDNLEGSIPNDINIIKNEKLIEKLNNVIKKQNKKGKNKVYFKCDEKTGYFELMLVFNCFVLVLFRIIRRRKKYFRKFGRIN